MGTPPLFMVYRITIYKLYMVVFDHDKYIQGKYMWYDNSYKLGVICDISLGSWDVNIHADKLQFEYISLSSVLQSLVDTAEFPGDHLPVCLLGFKGTVRELGSGTFTFHLHQQARI